MYHSSRSLEFRSLEFRSWGSRYLLGSGYLKEILPDRVHLPTGSKEPVKPGLNLPRNDPLPNDPLPNDHFPERSGGHGKPNHPGWRHKPTQDGYGAQLRNGDVAILGIRDGMAQKNRLPAVPKPNGDRVDSDAAALASGVGRHGYPGHRA